MLLWKYCMLQQEKITDIASGDAEKNCCLESFGKPPESVLVEFVKQFELSKLPPINYSKN